MRNPVLASHTPDRTEYAFMVAVAAIGLGLAVYSLISLSEFVYRLRSLPWRSQGVEVSSTFWSQQREKPFRPQLPKTFDGQAATSSQVPLAVPEARPVLIDSNSYSKWPVRTIYTSYTVYHPEGLP